MVSQTAACRFRLLYAEVDDFGVRMRISILAIWVAESSVHNAPECDSNAAPAYSSR